jgi:excisionase family DNA binding protein
VSAGASDWLTLGAAAGYLGVSKGTLRHWADQGRVPAFYTPGGHRRFRRPDLEAFLERFGPAGRPRSGPSVLVVSPDAGARAHLRGALQAEGYWVREAADPGEGLALLEVDAPDLILLDEELSTDDGEALLRAAPVITFSAAAASAGVLPEL